MRNAEAYLRAPGIATSGVTFPRLPRYTSYPTAPNFKSLEPATYVKWLDSLAKNEAISLYIHVPYCQQLCWFCGCNTHITARYEPITTFLDFLFKELDLLARYLPERMSLSHIHFGGGSPTLLRDRDFKRLMKHIGNLFAIETSAEIAIEIDPRTLDNKKIKALSSAGINRASLGVQDFDPRVQRAINRVQPFELVREKAADLRSFGIHQLNVDLICGLPYQTVQTMVKTMEQVLELSPERVALFSYAHVPHMKKHQNMIPLYALPDTRGKRELRGIMEKILIAADYLPVGMDHFAKARDALSLAARNGTLRRNFQGYTTDTCQTLLGVGPSAISKTDHGYAQNVTDLKAWRAMVLDGGLPVIRGIGLSRKDRTVGAAIERLMCDMEVNLAVICNRFKMDCDFFAYANSSLQAMSNKGIIDFDGENICLLSKDRNAIRSVAACLDQYFPG